MILKRCPDCGQDKPLDAFADNARQRDGKAFYCKPCFNLRSAQAYRRRQARAGKVVRERVVVPDGYKRCPKCGETKSLSDFHRAPKQSGGRASYCKPCKRAADDTRRLQRLYGMTADDVAGLVTSQGGVCAVCAEEPAAHVDHDHATGRVRGAVCFRCNVALGHLRDDAALAERAAAYLRRTTAQWEELPNGNWRVLWPTG